MPGDFPYHLAIIGIWYGKSQLEGMQLMTVSLIAEFDIFTES